MVVTNNQYTMGNVTSATTIDATCKKTAGTSTGEDGNTDPTDDTGEGNGSATTPNTGDNISTVMWLLLLFAAVLVGTVHIVLKKRGRNRI